MAAVTGALAYQPGVTHARTTAAEALATGAGVSRDRAHVLRAAARDLGIPARYVSGYLMADGAGPSPGAAHAWAEPWIGGSGWVGFDPANACSADGRLEVAEALDQATGPRRRSPRSFRRCIPMALWSESASAF